MLSSRLLCLCIFQCHVVYHVFALLHIAPEPGASAAGGLTMMPFLVSDSRLRLGRMMSQDRSPTTPAVRSTSHFSSLAGCRAAEMVLRLAPAHTVTCCQ